MKKMKLCYETSDLGINVVLEVYRPIEKKWNFPEINARKLLSENLEKIVLKDHPFKNFLSKIFSRYKDNFNLKGNRINYMDCLHYHFYKGEIHRLPKILKYCKKNRIRVNEGISSRLKSIINS